MNTRRDFIRMTGVAALAIGFRFPEPRDVEEAPFKPNAWISIQPSGRILLTVGKTEMGQGVRTSLPMILADEMGADLSKVDLVQASPGKDFTNLGTGGSWSIGGSWKTLRTAGAAAREMLIAAAAARWSVDPETCIAANGEVVHPPTSRRFSFGALTGDAARSPVPAQPRLKSPSEFKIIGQRVKRLDGPRIVDGSAKYGIDTRVPNMRYASIVRSPRIGASVRSWKGDKAKAVRGVENVVQISSGVAVVANRTWSALKGHDAVEVEWADGPGSKFKSDEHRAQLERAARGEGIRTRKDGDATAALQSSARMLEASYFYPFYVHAPLETMNCTAHVHDGRCEVWVPTQDPNKVQNEIAHLLQIDPSKVDVHVTLVGGGFGRRLEVDYALEAVELSRAVGKPVQVLWSRTDDMHHGHFQAASAHYLRAGLNADQKLIAWTHTKAGSFHNIGAPPTADELKAPGFYQGWSWGTYDIPYAIPSIETTYVPVPLPVRHGPWRSVFSPSSTFARESFLDEVAHAAGKDPVAFRLEMLTGTDVVEVGEGDAKLKIDRRRLRRVIATAAERGGWGTSLPAGRGRGFACNVYDGDTHLAYVVDVTVSESGQAHVDRLVAAIDCGVVINPTGIEQQIEGGVIWGVSQALKGSITIHDGQIEQHNYRDYEVARMRDAPRVEVHIIPGEGSQPFGVGEPPVPPLAPALTNAIFAATGKRVRHLPVRPEDLIDSRTR